MKVNLRLKDLVGSGDRIALFMLPFVVVGLALNFAFPAAFHVGGPPPLLRAISVAALVAGIVMWAWSVVLILTRVPRRQLITTGPFAVVKHPLYTSVALLVLPWAGFLLDTWLGAALGAAMYIATRLYAPAEETQLAMEFGDAWDQYARAVIIPWL